MGKNHLRARSLAFLCASFLTGLTMHSVVYATNDAAVYPFNAGPSATNVKESVAVGTATTKGSGSVAVGKDVVAGTFGDIVIGNSASTAGAKDPSSTREGLNTAIGFGAAAKNGYAIGIGTRAKTSGFFSVAVGGFSEIMESGSYGIALGVSSYVGEKTKEDLALRPPTASVTSIATNTEEVMGTVEGDGSSEPTYPKGDPKQTGAMALGWNSRVFGYNAIALGSATYGDGRSSIAIGTGSRTYLDESIAMGSQAAASRPYTIAVGRYARTLADFGVAVGNRTEISEDAKNAVVLGSWARAKHSNSASIGAFSSTEGNGAPIDGNALYSNEAVKASSGVVSIGTDAYSITFKNDSLTIPDTKRRITNVAGGIKDNDAVNVKQLKAVVAATGLSADDIKNINDPDIEAKDKPKTLVERITDLQNTITNAGIAENVPVVSYDGDGKDALTLGGKGADGNPAVATGVALTNVKDGKVEADSKDAVNGGQLHVVKEDVDAVKNTVNSMKGSVDSVNNSINTLRSDLQDEIYGTGSLNAALSALKPLQYHAIERNQIMAGVGTYKGSVSLALGVAHYRTESQMFHVGLAFGGRNSDFMANAGFSWRYGNARTKALLEEYAKQHMSQNEAVLYEQVKRLETTVAMQQQEMQSYVTTIQEQNRTIYNLAAKVQEQEQQIRQIMNMLKQ